MNIDLESIGFTQEELQSRVVDRIVERLVDGPILDEDNRASSGIMGRMEKKMVEMVDTKLDAMMDRVVGPNMAAYIEKIVITPTNQYGERKGSPKTLIEYMTERATDYLNERVDKDGKGQGKDSYSWKPETTRACWLANRELKNSIVEAMNATLNGTQATIGSAIAEAVRLSVENIKHQFLVTLKPVEQK